MSNNIKNFTDPIVRVDRTIAASPIAKVLAEVAGDSQEINLTNTKTDNRQVDGIEVPLIKVNDKALEWSNIVYCKIYNTGLLPAMDLVVSYDTDADNLADAPGMDNKVTAILISPIDGIYKKMSIDFYIVNSSPYNGKVAYTCKYLCPPLEVNHTTTIIFNGCAACGLGKNKRPTTFEFLHRLASLTGLGFSATDQCKEITDNNLRILQSTVAEAIPQHIGFGGKNGQFFDAWIDPYGYITMVNLTWVLKTAPVEPDDLILSPIIGHMFENAADFGPDIRRYTDKPVTRYITNNRNTGVKTNIYFKDFKLVNNNESIINSGTNSTFYSVTPTSIGGNNSISTENITVDENTKEGKTDSARYNFEIVDFIGTEMADNTPILVQEKQRKSFLSGYRSSILEVTLDEINLGIQRGTLINVDLYVYSKEEKINMITMLYMAAGHTYGEAREYLKSKDANFIESLNDDTIEMPNFELSGLYYVDGIEYEYSAASRRFVETLYLIKRDPIRHTVQEFIKRNQGKDFAQIIGKF